MLSLPRRILGGRLEWGEIWGENGASILSSCSRQPFELFGKFPPGSLGAFSPSIKPLCWGGAAAPIFLQGGGNLLLNFAPGLMGNAPGLIPSEGSGPSKIRHPSSSKAPFVCGSAPPSLRAGCPSVSPTGPSLLWTPPASVRVLAAAALTCQSPALCQLWDSRRTRDWLSDLCPVARVGHSWRMSRSCRPEVIQQASLDSERTQSSMVLPSAKDHLPEIQALAVLCPEACFLPWDQGLPASPKALP